MQTHALPLYISLAAATATMHSLIHTMGPGICFDRQDHHLGPETVGVRERDLRVVHRIEHGVRERRRFARTVIMEPS